MRRFIAHITALACLAAIFTVAALHARSERASGLTAIHHVDLNRRSTWSCQDELHVDRRPTWFLERRTPSARYRWWLATWWGTQRSYYCRTVHRLNAHPWLAVEYAFSRVGQGAKAVDVSRCETGGTFWIGAENGQYLGLMQMGSHERATCGHGMTALRQAFAALCWWRTAGGWGRWSCA